MYLACEYIMTNCISQVQISMMYDTLLSNIFDIAMSPLVYWKCVEGEVLTENYKIYVTSYVWNIRSNESNWRTSIPHTMRWGQNACLVSVQNHHHLAVKALYRGRLQRTLLPWKVISKKKPIQIKRNFECSVLMFKLNTVFRLTKISSFISH